MKQSSTVRLLFSFLSLLALSMFLTLPAAADDNITKGANHTDLSWPAVTAVDRPGTRWWWMGSAVDPQDLTNELTAFHDAGLGTVEITAIYGVKGCENQFIDFLSPRWMQMLNVAISRAHALGMNADMSTTTGWCFGGPNVTDEDANALAVVQTFDITASAGFNQKFDPTETEALVAFGPDGKSIDLTNEIAPDGSVSWLPNGPGEWHVYVVSQKPSGVKVKRSAPGGAGWMLNLLYPDSMPRYLQRFTDAFSTYHGARPQTQFHDSYEYNSDWAPDFFAQFEKRRGYRLQTELPALFDGIGDPDHVARVKSDYRETISDLIEESISRWTAWSHSEGFLTREQAHGSPGNWLDIYAAADTPETEMFNNDRDILVSKFASSAADVTGKKLVSSETGTWLAEHFTETLAEMKYLIDDMYLSGVNRVMYHGTTYSPANAPWPGWCFYASSEMNPRNSIWHDVPALNAYATRVQSVLHHSAPDNDILLYWPIYDKWHDPNGMVQQFTIRGGDWFTSQPIGPAARKLWDDGYTFDYISDKQLLRVKASKGALLLPGSRYKAIVVPPCQYMPVETLTQLAALRDAGASVIFENNTPQDVPGLGDLDQRRAEFRKLLPKFSNIVPADQLAAALSKAGVWPELSLTSSDGLRFVRRGAHNGFVYFIVNQGSQSFDNTVTLSKPAASAALMDPMTGVIGTVPVKDVDAGAELHVQLEPGQSLIVRTFNVRPSAAPVWQYHRPIGRPIRLTGAWDVKFIEGGPSFPQEYISRSLGTWTTNSEAAQNFGGTALYTLHFDSPITGGSAGSRIWSLDLGNVSQSARVRLNGRDLATVFIPPFRVTIGSLKPKDNVLEVEVTNTSSNRIRDLDRRGVQWKIFYPPNVLNVDYKPFDASNWPVADSGLIGPVTIQPISSSN